jgi:HSP20 family protein
MNKTEMEPRGTRVPEAASAAPKATCLPPVDVIETVEAFVVVADLPGVAEQDVDVALDRNLLTVRARRGAETPAGFQELYREYMPADFERSFTLGDTIDRGGVQAVLRNGVLRLTLPKVKEVRPRRIPVTTGA